MRRLATLVLALACAAANAAPAAAWGAGGHRLINGVAAAALPAALPAFVRSADAVATIRALGPEADRQKDAGRPRDADVGPAHILDLDDDGTVGGVVPLAALPPTREAYDTLLRTGHPDGKRAPNEFVNGYLPYEIMDGWELVVKDFALWRVARYAEEHAVRPADRAAYAAARKLREMLTIRDLGYWGHFVADGSQPMHVSVHYNGWGPYPNPENFSDSKRLHAAFEVGFVNRHATDATVAARLGPYVPQGAPSLARVGAYLLASNATLPAFYRLEAGGAFDAATPAAIGFTLDRLAAGAQTLRDWTADAYAAAADAKVGYRHVTVREIESGREPVDRGTLAD